MQSLLPLVLDVGIPLASYYVLRSGFGLGEVAALGWSSVVPALRTVWGLVRGTGVNGLAVLILVVNVVGLALSTMTGDPRLMLAKDGGVSSVIGIAMIVSVFLGKPLMTAGLKPFVTKGSAAKNAAWERLLAESARFRRAERRFSLIWGTTLLTECAARVIGAYTVPVHTMVWLGTVLTVVAILLAMVVAGGSCAEPMEKMVQAEAERVGGQRDGRAPVDGAGAAAAVPAVTVPAGTGS
ncbi:VC0807 family protein [Streptomyces sp. DSM 41527]|uniref:VC0807 family protein n=1 Tax=Streptomyces mooreae TaxID=3075523 RepID=A0ABU2T2M5_9ACTN|nr:VC0807 family protein [Streptomyces sp. DSM 41527]MDT0455484.1 VC0807 family protein [Streptomyces sp. DSM 41527]